LSGLHSQSRERRADIDVSRPLAVMAVMVGERTRRDLVILAWVDAEHEQRD
jgi:transcriptional regulator of met regulon